MVSERTERWRVEYNTQRPHSARGYRPPAPQAVLPRQPGHGDMKTLRVSTSPHLRRRLRTNVQRGVTLTLHLVQKIGPVTWKPKYDGMDVRQAQEVKQLRRGMHG